MLPVQVNYWTLQETIRHNKATENLTSEQNKISQIQAEAAKSQAETAAARIPIDRMNAETNRLNYGVNLQNAGTNAYNADINAQNAATNARNAEINAQNARTNEWNAAIRDKEVEYNYEINSINAATNAYNAETQRKEYKLHAEETPYKIAGHQASASKDTAQAEKAKAETTKVQTETKYVPYEKTANIVNTWVDSATTLINTIVPKKKSSTTQTGDAIKSTIEMVGILGGL
jgi:chromosome segregation ATPase